MQVLCTICMRGGSKGFPNKNLKKINGKAIMYFSITQAINSKIFDKIIISTDSKKIFSKSISYGAEGFFLRSKKLSDDRAGKVSVIRDALIKSELYYKNKFDYIVDLDVTSPLRTVNDIKFSFNQFIREKSDNLVTASLSKKNPYFNLIERNNKNILGPSKKITKLILRRQDAPITYDMNASIYIWKRKKLLNSNKIFNKKTSLYLMAQSKSIDIDSEQDYKIVKFLIEKKIKL